jgi:adenosylcobinamide kinase/adenosylcobinamide-phosphate guanylyltransferase
VRRFYELKEETSYRWCNGYEQEVFLPGEAEPPLVVFEGMETLIRRAPDRAHWSAFVEAWHEWEQATDGRRVVWIGCDITQGIVPLVKEEREWRDVTGWCYQQLAERCDRVDRVWCGLAERMKS